ncbi:hypothetical protein HanRHA438_Chr06g0269941 [Helianthus annuus]|uniref:Uncharacterized protein n=1 Tax=Helianthus annuus TaxID=4232 RepID=A0A251UIE0_HELAN|nr:hypothetical protein HanXRQr2_Chr06g0260901 [Helianthus annuus]KAJ0560664.1 hypothetical protein HanHA300_Chr06g0213891 [Helianthus annuus]KAJ0573700.1 hypothetical protein HanHA89_Chr06g0229661 [Helianthus annuus]KAJ0740928.1 hypothetical protein HanOQP8_Chr06g0222201 [Helianthus annuus]KAJ0912050.1 hypothetical protein HanRHA438_Chr06g0269941 [Helianthus annuus]
MSLLLFILFMLFMRVEERVKVVEHMWDVYVNSRRINLQRFWQDAFVATYKDLTSDVVEMREAAIMEIAKMSFWFIDLDLSPPQSTVVNFDGDRLLGTGRLNSGGVEVVVVRWGVCRWWEWSGKVYGGGVRSSGDGPAIR